MISQPFVARPGGTELRSSIVLATTCSPTWAFLKSTVLSSFTRIKVPGVNCIATGTCGPPAGACAWAGAAGEVGAAGAVAGVWLVGAAVFCADEIPVSNAATSNTYKIVFIAVTSIARQYIANVKALTSDLTFDSLPLTSDRPSWYVAI